jgi:hypothetical protein
VPKRTRGLRKPSEFAFVKIEAFANKRLIQNGPSLEPGRPFDAVFWPLEKVWSLFAQPSQSMPSACLTVLAMSFNSRIAENGRQLVQVDAALS